MDSLVFIFCILLTGPCYANIDYPSLMDHLLSKNENRMLQELDGVRAETYIMEVLLNLLMVSKDIFPTAFSNNVSPQCKSDSVLYMDQVVYQSFLPVPNPWALRSEFLYGNVGVS